MEMETQNTIGLQPISNYYNVIGIKTPYSLTSLEILNKFLNSLDIKDNTKNLYARTLKLFFKWVNQKNYLIDYLTRVEILEYKKDLLISSKSSLTATTYLTTLRVFYQWTEANKIYPNICKGIKSPKRKQLFNKRPLTPEQTTGLLMYFEKNNFRNYVIANLLLRTGLRTIELTRANVSDITQRGENNILLVHGKGSDAKDDFVELTDKAYKPLLEYLEKRKTKPEEPLFISTSNNNINERLTTRTISKIIKDGLRAIGINEKHYTAHSLRHTGATMILKTTNDLDKTRLFCRHTNPATTLIYTATLNQERKLQNSGASLLDKLF